MNNTNFFLEKITDNSDDGIIFIDNNKIIQLFNRKSKEILGIVLNKPKTHSSGKLNPGDIVVITDNALGIDDGNLSTKDLEKINIFDSEIKKEYAIIGIGVYENKKIKPAYKYWRSTNIDSEFKIDEMFLGFNIKAYIDVLNKILSITINDETFNLNYAYALGHIVVICGKTGAIKFFQERGYTIRKENIRNLLLGHIFLAKKPDNTLVNVIGKKVDEIIEHSDLLDEIYSVLDGKRNDITNDYFEINKRPTLCSLYPIKRDNIILGVQLKIRDISELESLLRDRNKILDNIETIDKNIGRIYSNFPEHHFAKFVGNSNSINEVKFLAYKASKIKSNVLITGENGTGKSLLANLIHELHRKNKPFIEVNCNAIPHNLFESELFGYVKGAFTGALNQGKAGYFESANGGTIFLDEIGELPKEIQIKLLHVLQNKKFFRVGSTKPIDIDVRVIAATNRDLEKAIENGSFREDLYYRLNVFPIQIPPLRERKKDIYLLINQILNKLCLEYNLELKQLSGEALNKLIQYDWPGNVRELENMLERAIAICDTNIIYPEHIRIQNNKLSKNTLKYLLDESEKKIIEDAITIYGKDKSKIIESLDISRSSFYEKVKKYNIEM